MSRYVSKTAGLPKCSMKAKLVKRTAQEIEAGKSPKGGFNAATLASWGVPWPPPRHWQYALLNGISLTLAEQLAPKERAKAPPDAPGVLTTVFTDASFHLPTRCGGWGAWFKNHKISKEGGGPFKDWPASSTEAEIWAILNGIHLVITHAPDTTRVHVVSDCEGAMHILQGQTKKAHNLVYGASMRQILAGRSVSFAHVKAHTGADDARSYINNKVDKLAGKGSQEMRKLKGPAPNPAKTKVRSPKPVSPYASKHEKNRAKKARNKANKAAAAEAAAKIAAGL